MAAIAEREPHVQIHLAQRGTPWAQATNAAGSAWAKGYAFLGDRLLDAQALAALFLPPQGVTLAEHAQARIKELNGNWAVVAQAGGTTFAAVDQVRSIPLFYGVRPPDLYLSDEATWVRAQMKIQEMDPLAAQEFLLTGYVTGSDTVFGPLKQLQAGEYVLIRQDGERFILQPQRYFRFLHGDFVDRPEDALLGDLEEALVGVFQRLIRSAEGRQLVIPLSGGVDSRGIVTMLRYLGHRDVVAFSYGVPGNKEATISRRVAEALGYPWLFAPYSHPLWRRWVTMPQWEQYFAYAGQYVSLPHIQDWPAVWQLREGGKIASDALFVPGQSGIVAGSVHVFPTVLTDPKLDLDLVLRNILESHYGLRPIPAHLRPLLLERIRSRGIVGPATNAEEAANLFSLWEWQERHSKFIINSVRAYEFWGYDWRLPLWDMGHVAFWQRIPLAIRRGKRLFIRHQIQLWERMGLPWPSSTRDIPPLKRQTHRVLRRFLERTGLLGAGIGLNRLIMYLIQYATHPWAAYGIHSFAGHLCALGWKGLLYPPPGLCIASVLTPVALEQFVREGLSLPKGLAER